MPNLTLARALPYCLIAALYFVWPLPHTIALRFTLLAVAVIYFFTWVLRLSRKSEIHAFEDLTRIRPLIILLGALTIWMIGNALWISPEPAWALSEIEGQWINALISALLGVLIGITAYRGALNARAIIMAVILALALHTVFLDVSAFYGWLAQGDNLRRVAGLTDGPDKSNYLTVSLLGFVFSEMYFRFFIRKAYLPLSTAVLAALAVLGLLGFYLEQIRNGLAPTAFIFASFLVLYIMSQRRILRPAHLAAQIMLALTVASTLIYVNVKTDARWHHVVDSARLAWQSQDNAAWLTDDRAHKQTSLPNGKHVEESAYLRTVMLKEGLEIVAAHPLGIGYGRNAFGHGLQAKYGWGAGHSHSGLLDLAIGIGIPGVLLWLALLGYAAYFGARAFMRRANYAGLALLITVVIFSIRMLFDSLIRDHMLQQFMFTAALLAVLTLNTARPSDHHV